MGGCVRWLRRPIVRLKPSLIILKNFNFVNSVSLFLFFKNFCLLGY